MNESKNLIVEHIDGVMVVRINRPAVLNALSAEVLADLDVVFKAFNQDDTLGAALLTGGDTGKKPAFAAGADISEMSKLSGYELRSHSIAGQRAMSTIENSSKPVVAAVNGFALGGGLELAMCCHFRFASNDALMGQPEINLGIIPGFGGSQRLPRLIGKGNALELLLTGDAIKADRALELGLVERVIDSDQLFDESLKFCQKLASKAPIARALILDSVNRGLDCELADALGLEADLFGIVGATEDVREGLNSFLEKRKPDYKGK
ncbi:MAG: enoyl-CoA hydratase [Planctomycetota bacterium]|jgi:enoyl-CoA hydratase